jgi:hypothetical protein
MRCLDDSRVKQNERFFLRILRESDQGLTLFYIIDSSVRPLSDSRTNLEDRGLGERKLNICGNPAKMRITWGIDETSISDRIDPLSLSRCRCKRVYRRLSEIDFEPIWYNDEPHSLSQNDTLRVGFWKKIGMTSDRDRRYPSLPRIRDFTLKCFDNCWILEVLFANVSSLVQFERHTPVNDIACPTESSRREACRLKRHGLMIFRVI